MNQVSQASPACHLPEAGCLLPLCPQIAVLWLLAQRATSCFINWQPPPREKAHLNSYVGGDVSPSPPPPICFPVAHSPVRTGRYLNSSQIIKSIPATTRPQRRTPEALPLCGRLKPGPGPPPPFRRPFPVPGTASRPPYVLFPVPGRLFPSPASPGAGHFRLLLQVWEDPLSAAPSRGLSLQPALVLRALHQRPEKRFSTLPQRMVEDGVCCIGF